MARKPRTPKPADDEVSEAPATPASDAAPAKAPTLTKHEGGIVSLDY